MSNHTRSTNIAIFTRSCWLAGFSLDAVIRSCRRCGATETEIGKAVVLYASSEFALRGSVIVERGAHLDRRTN
jgi:hypothetical protein